ncbi:MAG TPA: hypothetical protein DCZ13_02030 [Porticoccaceae bacterium]|nr:hypothetical protein [Porticoccaceae bacterium]
MQMFLSVGKFATVGFWILPLLALFGVFESPWNFNLLWIGILIFFAHLGELVVIQGKLRMHDRDTAKDGMMVILAGFFHWLPIIRQQPTDQA